MPRRPTTTVSPKVRDPFPEVENLTAKQLCQLITGLGRSQLQQARKCKNPIPHVRVTDRVIRYPKALVLEWWHRRTVT